MKLILIALAFALAACSPALQAGEKLLENKVDETIDKALARLCKGPVDVAVRTFKRHPEIHAAAIRGCPETYGWLAEQIRAKDARDAAMRALVLDTINKALATQ